MRPTGKFSVVIDTIAEKELKCDSCGKMFRGSLCTIPFDAITGQIFHEEGYRDIVCLNCVIELIVNTKKQLLQQHQQRQKEQE